MRRWTFRASNTSKYKGSLGFRVKFAKRRLYLGVNLVRHPTYSTEQIFATQNPKEPKKKDESNPKPEETLLPAQADDELELDEMWSFVLKKSEKRWLWTVLCRRTRRIVAHVIGDRSEKTCRKLWKLFQKNIKVATLTAISGMPTKRCFRKKPIGVLAKKLDKPVTWNVEIIHCDNRMLAMCAKPCHSQKAISIIRLLHGSM